MIDDYELGLFVAILVYVLLGVGGLVGVALFVLGSVVFKDLC